MVARVPTREEHRAAREMSFADIDIATDGVVDRSAVERASLDLLAHFDALGVSEGPRWPTVSVIPLGISALVPLIINEPASDTCRRVWNDATRTISSRLIYPETRAALAQAEKMGRLTPADLAEAVKDLDSIAMQIDHVEITAP